MVRRSETNNPAAIPRDAWLPGRFPRLATILVLLASIAPTCRAGLFDWNGPVSGGFFDDPANWIGSVILIGEEPPPVVGDTARFASGITGGLSFGVKFRGDHATNVLDYRAGNWTFFSDAPRSNRIEDYTLSLTTGSADARISGGHLRIGANDGPLHLVVGNQVEVFGDSQVTVWIDSSIETANLDIAANTNDPSGGHVLVRGQGATLNVTDASGFHQIGPLGDATLEFTEGASGNIAGTLLVGQTSFLGGGDGLFRVAEGANVTTGTIQIGGGAGGGSTAEVLLFDQFELPYPTITQSGDSQLVIGGGVFSTPGVLNISNGTFTTGAGLTQINRTGEVNLNTFSSAFRAMGDVELNGGVINYKSGEFALVNGGTLLAKAGGQFNNPTTNDTVVIDHGATWRFQDSADLNITNTSRLAVGGAVTGDTGNGTLIMEGQGTHLNVTSTTWIARLPGTEGSITIRDGATANFKAIEIARESPFTGPPSTGALHIESGANVVTEGIDVVFNSLQSQATMTVSGQGTMLNQTTGPFRIGSSSQSEANVHFSDQAVVQAGGLVSVFPTGHLQVDTGAELRVQTELRVGGDLRVADSGRVTLSDNANLRVDVGGRLFGSDGIIDPTDGALVSEGTVAPGESAGRLRILGGYRQLPMGVLEIELGGTIPIAQHDVLRIEESGTVELGGTLQVSLLNDFVPAPGNEFVIVNATASQRPGSIEGAFAQLNLPSLGANFWNIDYGPDAVTLQVLGAMQLAGDHSGNGVVEQADLDLVLLRWGDNAGLVPGNWAQGFVDQNELDEVLLNWGRTIKPIGQSAAVPEPSTLLLACIIALGAGLCARRGSPDHAETPDRRSP